jgi:ubiquinone/menaquinone biosynthesis C-methylase UbiE
VAVGDAAAAQDIAGPQPVSGHVDQVRRLFDSKAAGWPAKYAPGGRLSGRLVQLAGAVADLVVPGGELLDLGCGSGELARNLAAAGFRVTGCDITPRMLRQATAADPERTVRWVELEPGWTALPFAAGSLDAVVAASVLEYVADPVAVLSELARVLRPGGVVLCTVPNVAHPVRWLEWPLRLLARTSPARLARHLPRRAAQYVAYLRTSSQRQRVRGWQATATRAGLTPVRLPRLRLEPLRPLVFTRPRDVARHRPDPSGDKQ